MKLTKTLTVVRWLVWLATDNAAHTAGPRSVVGQVAPQNTTLSAGTTFFGVEPSSVSDNSYDAEYRKFLLSLDFVNEFRDSVSKWRMLFYGECIPVQRVRSTQTRLQALPWLRHVRPMNFVMKGRR